MAADREVLREFLVSLGFQVDEQSARRFLTNLTGICKFATGAGAAVAGVAVAAETMVTVFASRMEKMYYASKRAQSSVSSLQAIEYGFGQIGLTSEDARRAVEGMSRAMRLNPGLQSLLENLGVKVEGRDRVAVLTDFIGKLKSMPFYQASQYAEMFGIDPDTLLLMEQGLNKLLKAEAERRRMNRDAGVDAEKAAAASREYMNSLRELWVRVEVLAQALEVRLLPYFRKFVTWADRALISATKFIASFSAKDFDLGSFHKQLTDIITDVGLLMTALNNWFKLGKESGLFGGMWENFKRELHGVLDLIDAALSFFTGQWGRAWEKVKSAGVALGPSLPMNRIAGITGQTVPELGQSAAGFMASANPLSWLLRMLLVGQGVGAPGLAPGGALGMMANPAPLGGTGLLGMALAPSAGAQFFGQDKISISQTNTFNIQGGDAAATGRAVASEIKRTNGDLVRNFTGATR